MRSKFKAEHPLTKRKAESERIRQKYTDRIPVSPNFFVFFSMRISSFFFFLFFPSLGTNFHFFCR